MKRHLILVTCVIGFPFTVALGWSLLSMINSGFPITLYLMLATAFSLIACFFVWDVLLPQRSGSLSVSREREVRELLASRTQYHNLYENSPVPYLTIGQNGRIEMYNLAAVRLFQTTKTDLVGADLETFLVDDESSSLVVVTARLEAGSPVSDHEIQIKTTKDESRWVLISIFPSERTKQRLVSMVDITDQKKIDIAKSEFVALATHQLRTPIAAIRWNMELLSLKLEQENNGKYQDYVNKVDRNVFRMIALINDFLSVSKLETGTFATERTLVQLDTYLDTIIEEFAKTITEKHLKITTKCVPPAFSLLTDQRLLHIITSNLVSNAVKYTPENGQITISYQVTEKGLSLTIADTGIGIPKEEQDTLFQKFFRATNAQRAQAEGTGLGAYAVKQSVDKLGGTLHFESKENKGTAFTVNLPI